MPQRNKEWVSLLFKQHSRALLGFLSGRVKSQDIEDLAQKTYLQLLQHPNPDEIRDPQAYLFRTASNLAIDHLRQCKVRVRDLDQGVDLESITSLSPEPDNEIDGKLQLKQMLIILEKFPPKCAFAFLLNRIDGLTHAEIAQRLGISKKTVERYIIKVFETCYIELDR